MRPVSLLCALGAAALLAGCPKPYVPPGGDGGALQDGGTEHDAGGTPGVTSNPSYTCDPGSATACASDSECMFVDAGRGSLCLAGPCDVVRQTGCADGEKCTYVDDGGVAVRACAPDGTAGLGEGCSSSGPQCLRGFTCVDLTGAGTSGTCQRFCGADADCADLPGDAGQECGDVFLLPGGTIESPSFCTAPAAACDLFDAASCSAQGTACYSGPRRPTCYAAGTSPLGGPCAYTNDCVPGALCASSNSDARCRQLCRSPSGAPSCSTGVCTATQIAGASNVGVCL